MSSDILQRFMKDLIKNAKETEGFIKGSRMTVEIGGQTKAAMDASTMLGGIPGMGPALSGLNASARDNSMPSGAMTGIGSALGQTAGAAGGNALGGMLDNDKLQMLLTLLGSSGGGMLGAAGGRGVSQAIEGEHSPGHGPKQASTIGAVNAAGIKAAAARFGVKEAFLGGLMNMAGSVGGGMLARKMAPNVAGFAGHALEMGGQMAGGALTNRLTQSPGPMG